MPMHCQCLSPLTPLQRLRRKSLANNATLSTIFHMFHFLIIFDRHRASDLQHNGPVAQVVVNQAEKAPNANPVGIMSGSHVTEGS